MKRTVSVALIVVLVAGLMLVFAAPSNAWDGRGRGGFHGGFHHGFHPGFRSRVFLGVGPAFVWGPGYWGYPYAAYPYAAYPYYAPPPVVIQEPPVYVQPPVVSQAPAQEGYWYYCASAQKYYPDVQTCPEAWIQVPPRSQ
jgi:hypothetical protein